jgi:hypothetical protein
MPGARGQHRHAAHAARRPGSEQADRIGPGMLNVGDAAVALHHEQPAAEAGLAQPADQAVEIVD